MEHVGFASHICSECEKARTKRAGQNDAGLFALQRVIGLHDLQTAGSYEPCPAI